MPQILSRQKSLTRLAVFCLGTSALTVPALAAVFSVGGGTITTTQADNSFDNTGTGGAFELQANTTGNNDTLVISNVTINSPGNNSSLDVGGSLPSSGSYSVTMHGSTLTGGTGGWFQSVNGLISLDTTGGAANTMSGDLALTVAISTGTGGASLKLGADNITSTYEAVQVGGGNGTISIDMAGTTVTSSGPYGVVAQNGLGNITIGGLNGGLTGSITANNGYGIYSSSNGTISLTIAPSGSVTALNAIWVSAGPDVVNNFGTISATNKAIDASFATSLNVTLQSSSTTSGIVLGSPGSDTFTVFGGANISGATFNGNGGSDTLVLTGSGNGIFSLASATNISSFQMLGGGIWTLTGTPGSSGAWIVASGTLRAGGNINLDAVTINGGVFDVNGQAVTVGALSGAGGAIALGSGSLTTSSNTNVSLATAISGAGSLTKVGSGALTLTGTNTYTGATTISAGTLALSGSGSIANSSAVVTAGAFDISATTNGATIRLLGGSPGSSVILGNKTLTITNNTNLFNSGSYGGDITGSGNVIISAGTQYFGGAKSYTGTTTIASGATLGMTSGPQNIAFSSGMVVNGTLHLNGIGAVAKTLSGSGSVTGGSGLTITNGSSTFSGAIGSDDVPIGLTIAGGTQALSGPILVSTATTNPGATLAISGAGFLRPANSIFVNNGTFDISAATSGVSVQFLSGSGSVVLGNNTLTLANFAGTGFTSTFSGVISGTGGVIVAGGTGGSGANRILTGKNTYSGATTVQSGGILQLNSGGSLGNSAVTNAGTLQLGASSGVLSLSGTGLVSLGSSNLTLNNAGDIFSGTITGVGGSLTIVAGSETLAGTNSYTGGTIVNGGKLNVTGSIGSSAVTVASGATLGGTGTVGTTTVASGGTLAPGNSIGTLTVNGNLTLAPGSAYSVEVLPTAADRTMVSGNASINGTVITSIAAGTYVPGQRYTLLTASGVSGTFSSLNGIPASLKGQLSYDANNAYLTLSPNTLAPVLSNATGNQEKVVSTIDAAVTSGIVPGAGFQALYGLSGPALKNALDQISGQVGANTINAVGQASLSFLNMTAQGGGGGGNFASGSAYGAADAPHRAQLGAGQTRVWASAYGGHVGLSADAASGAASLSASNVGLIGGADMAWDDGFLAGVTLGLGRQNFSSGNGTGRSDDIMIGLYARKDIGPLYVTAAIGYGSHHIETLRVITVSGTDVLQGKQHADDYGGRIEAGWRTALDDQFTLSPYFAVAAQSFESPAYAETALSGASTFALSVAAHSSTLGRTELGSGLSRNYETENGVLTTDLRLAWAHQLDDMPFTQASFQTLPGASFLVTGVRPASDTALLGASVQVQNRSGLFFGLKGETQLGAGTTILEGMGNLGWRW